MDGGREGEKGQEGQMLKDGGVLMMTGKLSGVMLMGVSEGGLAVSEVGYVAGGCKGVEVGSGRGSEGL